MHDLCLFVLKLTQKKVLDWTGMEAGTLPGKEFMSRDGKFDLALFNETRERKLITLLAQEVTTLFFGIF